MGERVEDARATSRCVAVDIAASGVRGESAARAGAFDISIPSVSRPVKPKLGAYDLFRKAVAGMTHADSSPGR